MPIPILIKALRELPAEATLVPDQGDVGSGPRRHGPAAAALFGLLLIAHFWAVSVGWQSGLLPGNEFRQAQTAVTTHFIQRDADFSLAYPTPVLGKPWSIPMEFPLYQWTVAGVSSMTGQPIIQAARAVSCICFYLSLPAIWLLLRRLQLNAYQRWLTLGVILSSPLYVFYARAFLIETMALMFGLWFLQSFLAAVENRRPFWVIAANVTGIGAGLVKVTTFMVYLLPAAVCAGVWLWKAYSTSPHPSTRASSLAGTLGWIVACVALPFSITWGWIEFADAIKALNPSGEELVSSAMSGYHFGTWQTRLSSEPWLAHWRTVTTNITPWPGIIVLLVAGVGFGGRWRKWILASSLLFIAAPLTFPVLYAWHEYYFVANGVLLLSALGLTLAALNGSAAPRWAVWMVVLTVHALQAWTYFQHLYPTQRLPYEGGSGLTRLLRDLTQPDDVLVIAGNDWSSVIPFYAERRALMIRTSLENDGAYLQRAFARVSEESVPILILVGSQRDNRALLERVCLSFEIDPNPFLRHKDQTIYVRRAVRKEYAKRLFNLSYNDVTFADSAERRTTDQPAAVQSISNRGFFPGMSPQPSRYQVPFGLSIGFHPDGRRVFDGHAPSRLWFPIARAVSELSVEFGISKDAYQRDGARTDGVEFAVVEVTAHGTRREVFSRTLDPTAQPTDRGTQFAKIPVSIPAGSELIFETRPGPSGSNAFDWAYWKKIELR